MYRARFEIPDYRTHHSRTVTECASLGPWLSAPDKTGSSRVTKRNTDPVLLTWPLNSDGVTYG